MIDLFYTRTTIVNCLSMSENCRFAKNSRNTTMKHLIVGGVAGGATAAARIRRITEEDEIILF
mgnify:FL=1